MPNRLFLAELGRLRAGAARQPGTLANQKGHWDKFIIYLRGIKVSWRQVQARHIVEFLESRLALGLKHLTVLNYLSSIRAQYREAGCCLKVIQHRDLASWSKGLLTTDEAEFTPQPYLRYQELERLMSEAGRSK